MLLYLQKILGEKLTDDEASFYEGTWFDSEENVFSVKFIKAKSSLIIEEKGRLISMPLRKMKNEVSVFYPLKGGYRFFKIKLKSDMIVIWSVSTEKIQKLLNKDSSYGVVRLDDEESLPGDWRIKSIVLSNKIEKHIYEYDLYDLASPTVLFRRKVAGIKKQ